MRGEETQIAGALALHPDIGTGRHLLCLPGTHTKWAYLQDGQVRDFLTASPASCSHCCVMAAPCCARPMPARQPKADRATPRRAFERGVADASAPDLQSCCTRSFGVRSRQLIEAAHRMGARISLGPADRRGRAGRDSALRAGLEAVVIGDGALNERYAYALRRQDIAASCLDGEQCALAGLRTLWRT